MVPGPPEVTPKDVPAAPEAVSSTVTCSALRPGETLLSVSPEGQAWLVVAGSPSSIRVVDAFGAQIAESITEVDIAGIAGAQAWSGSDAAVLAEQSLWRLEDLARIELTPPSGFATPAAMCGDPGANGVLVSGGKVFERRGVEWWGWDPGVEGEGAPSNVVRYDGECQGTDDLMWLTSADGTLYRVEPAQFSRPVRFDGMVDAAATQGMIAVLDAEMLWVGPDAWQSWVFPGAVPTALAASSGKLWMLSGSQLLRFDGETWVEVSQGLTEPAEAMGAHAGGVWLAGTSQICHQAVGTGLRVEGVRPFSRSIELEYLIQVQASDGSADLTADVDGVPVPLAFDAVANAYTGNARLEAIGWHTLTLSAGGGAIQRTIPIKRQPEVTRSWATDVSPIYQASCASAECHRPGSTDPPDLGTYEAWKERSHAVRTRVVDGRTMPPAASIGPEWGVDDIEVIQEWLEGGMLP